jgi:tRNA(adenine34) deaminase
VASGFRKSSSGATANELDHAEIMALKDLWKTGRKCPDRLCLYSTLEPCLMCFGAVLISGIRGLFMRLRMPWEAARDWSRQTLPPLYRNLELTLVPNVCREESLQLLQRFFADAGNSYLPSLKHTQWGRNKPSQKFTF